MRLLALTLLAATVLARPCLVAQGHPPAIDFETALDTFFSNETGVLRLGTHVLAFAPERGSRVEAAVLGPDRKTLARHAFHDDGRLRTAVFERVSVQGPGEIPLTTTGDHNLLFLVNGKPVSRLAFRLEATAQGDDPFNPRTIHRLLGPWSRFAHLTLHTFKDQPVPRLSLWLGGVDLPAGARQDQFHASLLRGGREVAHSKRALGSFAAGHYKRTAIDLFHPHEEKAAANARLFLWSDWLVDGAHVLRITRKSDGAELRTFDFEVADGAIRPLARTQFGHEPLDYIPPRVQRKNTNTFEMIEAFWLEDR